jgi:hypothetical protein
MHAQMDEAWSGICHLAITSRPISPWRQDSARFSEYAALPFCHAASYPLHAVAANILRNISDEADAGLKPSGLGEDEAA